MKPNHNCATQPFKNSGWLLLLWKLALTAAGMYVPPIFVFPKVNIKAELKNGAPSGSNFACRKSGWIQQHLFTQWFSHFMYIVKPSVQNPVILI